MIYYRDIPKDDIEAFNAEYAHVIAHLSAVADGDDNPDTHASDVVIRIEDHPDNPDMIRLIGVLDAVPDAPYLKSDYDPWAGVDPALREAVLGG